MPADKGYNKQTSFRTSNADNDDSDGDDDDGDDDSDGDGDDGSDDSDGDADDDVVQPADKGCRQVSLRTAHIHTPGPGEEQTQVKNVFLKN